MISTPIGVSIADNASPPTMDNTGSGGDRAAVVCKAPKTGSISKMRYYVYAKTGSPTYDARCETVSSGAPSGTLKTAGSNVNTSPGGTGVIEVTFGTPASVTAGDMIAGVLQAISPTDGSNYIRPLVGFTDQDGIRGTTFGTYNIDGGGWTNVEHAAIGLVYDDGTVIGSQTGTIIGILTSQNIRSDTTPNEIANWYTADSNINVIGVSISTLTFGNTDNDFDVVLYNSSGSAQRTVNINNTDMPSSSAGQRHIQFSTPYEVAEGGQFGISILGKQSAKGSVTVFFYSFGANADRVTAFGWTAYMRTRTNTDAWGTGSTVDYNSGSDYSFAMFVPIYEIPTPVAVPSGGGPLVGGSFLVH